MAKIKLRYVHGASRARWAKRHPERALMPRTCYNVGFEVGHNFLRNYAFGGRFARTPHLIY